MKKVAYLLFAGILIALPALCQDEDYALTVRGDTLRGKLSIIDNPVSVQSLVVKVNKKKQSYPCYRISKLYKSENIYHVAKVEGRYQFVQLVKEGYLSLYRYTPKDQQSLQMFQGSVLITKDSRYQIVPNLGFRKQMMNFLEDCEEVQAKIENQEFTRKQLDEIIDEYNDCIPGVQTIKPGDIVEEIVYVPDTAEIDQLITAVQEDKELSSNKELSEMLKDVKKRIAEGDELPSYLGNILKSNLEGKQDLLQLLDKVLAE
ncbi:MAG: hypothetical protein JXQ96_04455 [Cyclobacteriaceae bacterium]